jgi:2-desacetyl-2-hydroxyethyl bacteriochlorophyllide A dehydrogenase
MMRAVRLFAPGQRLMQQELQLPGLGAEDVLIEVKAAGICHSDAHYRSGKSAVYPLPMTLGHEVAGEIAGVGDQVANFKVGDRVCVHYLVTCGKCHYCNKGFEQFCRSGMMIGKHRDGGYAEYLRVPERSVFHLPPEIPYEQGAILMCSSATSLHALHKARVKPGETIAIFGVGGLGMSAVQLAKALGADEVFAVDINKEKLKLAEHYGAVTIDASIDDPVEKIKQLTIGKGVDVSLELVGLPGTMEQAFMVLGIMGRLAIAGISPERFSISPYMDLINREAEIIGVSDHLAQEIPMLLKWVQDGKLILGDIITKSVPLDAGEINQILDQLESFGQDVRVVIKP